MMTERHGLKERACAGCGTAFKTFVHDTTKEILPDSGYYKEVNTAPEHSVLVCLSGRNRYGPKESCLAAARKNAMVCPGCGEEHVVQRVGDICETCIDNLDWARKARGEIEPTDVSIDSYAFESLKSSDFNKDLVHALLCALNPKDFSKWDHRSGPCFPPRRSYNTNSGAWTRIPKENVVFLGKFVELLVDGFKLQRRLGREEGNNLLVRLARGDLTTDVFDAEVDKMNGKKDEDA